MEEPPSEAPPEGMVGKVESELLPEGNDNGIIQRTRVFCERMGIGLVLVLVRDQKGTRIPPDRIVCPDLCDDLRQNLHSHSSLILCL